MQDQGLIDLKVKTRPGAGKTELKGKRQDGVYKIDVAAPPEKGKANLELRRFLAKRLGLKQNNVTIISGSSDKNKSIRIKL